MSWLELPRAVLLATWGTAALRDEVTPSRAAAAAALPDDEPGPGGVELGDVLGQWRRAGVPGLRVVLPVPGDPRGLPGPPAFNALACDAGECVITDTSWPPAGPGLAGSAEAIGLVPQLQPFGSAVEPGCLVTWTRHTVRSGPPTEVQTLAEADRELRTGLLQATRLLETLDVARWREDLAGSWADLTSARLDGRRLPAAVTPRAIETLATGLRLRGLVALALADDGGALSGWEAGQRREVLRGLDDVARRAVAAAANSATVSGRAAGDSPPRSG